MCYEDPTARRLFEHVLSGRRSGHLNGDESQLSLKFTLTTNWRLEQDSGDD